MRKLRIFIFLITFFSLTGIYPVEGWVCGKAPHAKRPQRRKAGEGFPPLPLPATPLRRTEKKNPPAPPVLIGKVICGPDYKWTRAGNDAKNLLRIASRQIGVSYRAIKINLNKFSFDPEVIPILYITSVEPFIPDERFIPKFRNYLEKGGFIWANASSGSPDFTREFIKFVEKLYPDRNLYKIYSNHPLKNCFYNLENLKILDEGKEKKSDLNLRILNIGCRAAIIFSPYDLGCGWAMHTHPWGKRYVPEDAIKIGINMVTYCLGWIEYGKLYNLTPVFVEKKKKKEGKIYIGQIIHSGDWNPHPSALGRLLKKVAETTKTSVYLEPIYVDLKKDNLDDIPILYITGHFNPGFSDNELKKLRKFLLSGGSLIADSCCGSEEFTQSFRAIMKKILPEAKVEIYSKDHTIYQIPFKIEKFFYTFPHKNTPPLEVYTVNGSVCAVFSPYGLGGGWEGIPRPYTFNIESNQAVKIGVNIITYLMTH
ncbi:MAG TPA: DUF4159 domain-containing protein [bacterium]|nr:DUF4159 domain-containing protein [bacterium]